MKSGICKQKGGAQLKIQINEDPKLQDTEIIIHCRLTMKY